MAALGGCQESANSRRRTVGRASCIDILLKRFRDACWNILSQPWQPDQTSAPHLSLCGLLLFKRGALDRYRQLAAAIGTARNFPNREDDAKMTDVAPSILTTAGSRVETNTAPGKPSQRQLSVVNNGHRCQTSPRATPENLLRMRRAVCRQPAACSFGSILGISSFVFSPTWFGCSDRPGR